jgi:hypothetical protein
VEQGHYHHDPQKHVVSIAAERIAELEKRLRVEQSCNRCGQYHGKEPCDDIAELEAELAQKEAELHIRSDFLSSRQCPDHSGKWERGRCLQCEIEELREKLDRVRPYLKHKRDCPQPTDITLDDIGIDTSCTCGLQSALGDEE